jgi:hypothetical protein
MSGITPTLPGIPGSEPEPSHRVTLDFRLMAGALLLFLGLGMTVLGGFHAFEHGTCSTSGYSRFGPVPHCAKGIGWWAGMLVLGIFVALAGGVFIANRSDANPPLSAVAAVLAGAIGVAGAFALTGGIKSIIGKVTTPSSAIVGGSSVGTLSAAQVRANKVKICQDLVVTQRLLSARVKSSLTRQCQADPVAAQQRLVVEAKAAALAYATAQCRKGVAGASGLPASAQATLAAQCGKSVKSGGTASTAATAATLCRQIVKAQVPAAAQQQALAACPKP